MYGQINACGTWTLVSDSGLFVELIEFRDEKEVASMTRTGARVEVDAHPSGDGSSISIR
jgi:hypothetical protein